MPHFVPFFGLVDLASLRYRMFWDPFLVLGDYAGLGQTRKAELMKAAASLGIPG